MITDFIDPLATRYGIDKKIIENALLLDMTEFYPAAHAIDTTDGFIADDFLGRVWRYNELVDSINAYRLANGKSKIAYPSLNSIKDYT
ncbi:hypothetical protein [Sodalis sp. RH22]|uniref:hypothetical protein n=1 Tax=unclassified Sodalis (in: enterobacteria) TaxID=2636512 RepID=UPI0039B69765